MPASPAVAAPGDQLGVYSGWGNTQGSKAFGTRLGRTLTRAHDFVDPATWASMTDASGLAQSWGLAGYANGLVLTVPMIPNSGGTLASGAAGEYNHYFRTLAERLVASGGQSAVLRVGPEFNGNWFAWTIDVPDGGALYAAYFRQIVTTMRAVPGSNFRFDWCANMGSSYTASGAQLDAESAYPGDAYVDYIGLDVYDQSWSTWKSDPAARWTEFLNARYGIRWHANFAAAHRKPMTFPEWGLASRTDGNGGGDAPYFVEQMYWWLHAHDVAYHLYFESRDPNGEYGVFSGRFPNAAARFVEYFGPNGPTQAPPPAPAALAPAPPAPLPPATAPGSAIGAGAGAGPTVASGANGAGGVPAPGSSGGAGSDAGAGPDAGATASASSAKSGAADAAKLSIVRAHVSAGRRVFELLAPISRKASGIATVTLHAGGRRTRYAAGVDSARGLIKLRKRVSAVQARTGTGIVEIAYKGDDDTQPSSVRLRAAGRPALLVAQRPRLEDGRLRAQGTVARGARGVVRVQLVYVEGGARVVREFPARIADGRWVLDTELPADHQAQIARRDGTLHSYTLYTGNLPARIRGEMRSAQVLGTR